MRFYNSDFHLIFDGGEVSVFRVPRMYIWLSCAFLKWILGVLGRILRSVLGGSGDRWSFFLRHRQTGKRKYAISYIRFSIDFCYICEGVKNQWFCASRCTNGDLMGWKFENFENFYFLVFQFVRPIVHIHFGSRPLHSPQVGLRVVFFTFHIGTQSCDYLKRISVNGLPIKIVAGNVKFSITIENKNWGVHARP